MKRLFDIASSLLALSVLLLPLLIVMLILRCTGEHQVFYRQKRVGLNGRRFMVLKFATMHKNSESQGTGEITLRNDPRVLPFGRILRATKLNEIPQLINVLAGDMSVIGWRPLPDRAFSCYSMDVQQQIVKIRPGLSGIGSILFRDEEALTSRGHKPPEVIYKEDIAPYKGELELWYQKNRCFWLDMKLILLTLIAVIRPHGRHHENWLDGLPPRPASLR